MKHAAPFFVLLLAASPAAAFGPAQDELFGVAPVPDAELAQMRGGFIAPGGLVIDFALSNQTIINGETLVDVTLNSAQLAEQDVRNLHQFIQIGENNSFGSVEEILSSAGLVTVIQNSVNETVIQTINQLDVTVENFNEYQANIPLSAALAPTDFGLR